VLLLDSEGKERVRLEGYLPNNDFVAALMSGLGCIAFVHKKYADAERWRTTKASNDHTVLSKVAEELRKTYPSSVWLAKRFRGCIREVTYQSECGDQRLHVRRSRLLPVRWREARPDRPDAVRPVQEIRRRRALEPSTRGQQELRVKNGWGGR
jgi:hypothetical protein